MNQTSPEYSAYGEPVSLKINIGKKSFERNEAHRKLGDNDNEIGLIDTDASLEDENMVFDTEEDIESEQEQTIASELQTAHEIPRWDSEREPEDNGIEQKNETPKLVEGMEDGAFMISADVVRQYGLQYQGGYMKFERDFQIMWVNQIQDPLGNEHKKKGKNKMDAFMQFSHVSVQAFNEVAKLSEIALEEYLAEHHIDANDFENWRLVFEFWENSNELAFDEETLFGDVARGAFIAKLEKDKSTAADAS